MRANTTGSATSILNSIYDNQINEALHAGLSFNTITSTKPLSYYEATGQSTMEWRTINTNTGASIYGKEEKMNITAGFARVKGGYLAQVAENGVIIWESKKRFKTSGKAIEAAQQKINKTIDILFNK